MKNAALFALLAVLAIRTELVPIDAAGKLPGPFERVLAGPDGAHAPATVPGAVSYQGRLLDSTTGNPLPDGSHSVTFSIWDAASAGTSLYSSGVQSVATQDGVFSVLLGGAGFPALPASVFNGTGRYLEVQVGAEVLSPRQQFTSVAYAFFSGGAALSNDSELLDSLDSTQFLRSDIAATKNGNLTLNNNLVVSGTAALNGNNTIGNQTTDVHTFNGSTTFNNGLTASGTTALSSVTANTLNLSGNATLGDSGSDTHTLNGLVNVPSLLNVTGNAVIGDALTDSHTVNGSVALNSNLLSTTGAVTLGNDGADLVTTNGDMRVLGNDIDNGNQTTLRINSNAGGFGVLSIGGTSQSDDVEIEDGGLCVGNGGCAAPADGHIAAASSVCVGTNACSTTPPLGSGRYDTGLLLGMGTGLSAASIGWGNPATDALTYVFPGVSFPNGRFSFSTELEVKGAGLCVDDGSGCPASLTSGTIVADGAVTGNAFDLSERFLPLDDDLAPGDLVEFADGAQVRRSSGTPYDAGVAGIISGDPGLILGWEEHGIPVALQGRVPLKVTLENGPIAPGDYLTSSSTPGHAMKATQAGATVGIALEAFGGADGDAGQVLTFVQRGDAHTANELRALAARVDAIDGGAEDEPAAPAPASAATADGDGGGASLWIIAAIAAGMVMALGAVAGIGALRVRAAEKGGS